ncbi:NAD(P)-dependent oxidoreductase [Beijerinckia sp. L45]|uniref:NAD(P)-dependent oxidoreductase n=1 Tax=Beijerinckia sp. L45 TaxID=1641855 RepID=UPI00131EBD24|nr:NAD(P)H-binding protein [Beijerinckia sp. L45]
MKILVVGAAGGVGAALVKEAVARGHEVTAFVHHRPIHGQTGVRIITGDARNAKQMSDAVAGQNAVLSAVGGKTPWRRSGLEPDTARTIVKALREHGVRRLVVASAMGAGDSSDVAGLFYKLIVVPTFLRGALRDKTRMEHDLAQTDVDWTVVRPAVLTDGRPIGEVKVFFSEIRAKAHSITRADVAAFMLDQLTSNIYLRQAVTIATS